MSDTSPHTPHAHKPSVIDQFSKMAQFSILGVIIAILLLSPAVIYYFTGHVESKLPVCTAAQPASATWRCKVDQSDKAKVAGGNPAYCPEGKQHFVERAWCNANWDKPIVSAQ
ncbi:hypothetical protein [uncultured Oxalicibacterium sp.]|uniref:hypothetical protein n=1 Tax=uncultured Oxalicibacterium sp. TaxID=1168540 RepID=UPI0025EAD823|nr:hypothetical protein [uncultured Oxalicibacterium sp.]